MQILDLVPILTGILVTLVGGILLAFVLAALDSRKKRRLTQRSLREELEKCSDLLIGKGNLCPIEMWEASKASGLLALLPLHKIALLSETYEQIKNHNYESNRVRDVEIMYQSGLAPKAKELWDGLSARLYSQEEALKARIEATIKCLSDQIAAGDSSMSREDKWNKWTPERRLEEIRDARDLRNLLAVITLGYDTILLTVSASTSWLSGLVSLAVAVLGFIWLGLLLYKWDEYRWMKSKL